MELQDIGLYAEWCNSVMDKIEEIAKEKYSNIVWVDTGSRWNVCMAILEQFKQDLKVKK